MSKRPRSRRGALRIAGWAAVATAVAVSLIAGLVVWSYVGPGPAARRGEVTTVVLERGSGVSQIAATLADAGVIGSAGVFLTAVQLGGAAGALQAGEYEFSSRTPMVRVLGDIRNGKVVRHLITIPEGWTSAMAAEAVGREAVLTGEVAIPPEGSLLPDTYQVQRGDSRAVVIRRMRTAQEELMAKLWTGRQPGLPTATPAQAVTLASIVEKETALASERPRIAAVFVNRLRSGMRLESDPTIIYGISRGRALGRGIRASELAAATPWNTYQIDGLPPTPIANPGREALAAVLNPPASRELFFVADGSGGHAFAETYAAHQANVARWRQVERARAEVPGLTPTQGAGR